MVALENRFIKARNGNVYSTTVCDYKFWTRYLQVFDEVTVLARVAEVAETELDRPKANGPGVNFLSLPSFVGPWQYLRSRRTVNRLVADALAHAEAFILRVPGTIATLLWQRLAKAGIPYGVEVVGDPWDALASGNVKSILRPLLRTKMSREMARQCRLASVASYVTEYSLQKRYPPSGWSTHYSSIELAETAFVDQSSLEKRIQRLKSKSTGTELWSICHVGMMEHLYKAPDILIAAVASCVRKGLNLELVMVGDGRFKSQLQQQVREAGLKNRVRFLGRLVPGESICEVLDGADLYVLPSRQEGLPRSLIEAMARGLPCIGSTVGGIPELLDDEDMVPPGNVEVLAASIESVIGKSDRLETMSRRNLQRARKYRSEELNKRRIEFYTKLIEQSKALDP